MPTPDNARAWLRTLTEEPHVAGTPPTTRRPSSSATSSASGAGRPTSPSTRSCSTIPPARPDPARAQSGRQAEPPEAVIEAPIATDKDSASPDAFPAFHGYGVSGDVDGPGRLCELRPARGLRGPREAGDRRQGQDRPGPLRRALPRPEGAQRPEARGGGDPDLFRPGRRRLRQGGRLSRRPVPPRLGGPARERPVPLARAGRPLDARRPVDQGGQAAADRRRERLPARPTERLRRLGAIRRSRPSRTGRRRPA